MPLRSPVGTRRAEPGELREIRRELHALGSAAPGTCALLLVLVLLSFAVSGASLIATGSIVGALSRLSSGGEARDLWTGIALLAACLLITPVLGGVGDVLGARLGQKVRVDRSDRLARTLLAPDRIHHLDSGPTATLAADLVEESRTWQILTSTESTVGVVTARIVAAAPLLIVAAWNIPLALVLAATALAISRLWSAHLSAMADVAMTGGGSETRRRHRYMFQLAGGAAAAREVRLFGMLPWIRPRLAAHERGQPLFTQSLRGARGADLSALLLVVVVVGIFLLAVHDASTGRLELGRLAAILPACVGVAMGFGPLGDGQLFMRQAGRFELRLDALAQQIADEQPASAASSAAPSAPADIEIRSLSFRYPGRAADTLHDLDIRIPAGQSVGIVGANGAGKSTLMALIAGLEPPTSGEVLIGRESAGPAPEHRARVAMILQDFARFPLSVRDNVLLGRDAADAEVRAAISRAGAASALERLDREASGLDTVLSPGFAGGTDLSGGQWQRLAIARALSAIDAGAGVLVLDEPTSALDVRAEAELFEDFLRVTRGMTTLLVSHRLSSVRRADRIIVIGEGRVLEDGSHEELVAAGGAYAEMFALQARRFTEAGNADA